MSEIANLNSGDSASVNLRSATNLPESPKIVFPHVMKTAGTSMGLWIAQHYCASQIMSEASTWKDFFRLPDSSRQQKKFVRGHFGSYITKYFGPEQGFESVTMLRSPVERVLSHFWHCKKAPDLVAQRIYKVAREDQFTLDDFLEHPVTRQLATNFQTANFAYNLERDYDPRRLAPRLAFKEGVSDSDYKMAQNFLNNCTVVGISEDLTGFTRRMSERFGFYPNERFAKTRSYQPQGFEISEEQRKKIERLNQMDIELYQWAKEQNAKPRALYVRPIVKNPLGSSLTQTAVWQPDKPFWGQGWSDTQSFNDPEIPPHRWSVGTTPATIEFDCAPERDCTINFQILRFVAARQLKKLTVLANGEQLDVNCIQRDSTVGPNGGIYSASFRPQTDKVTIQFSVGTPVSFKEVNPKDSDETPRGIALARVILDQTS